MSKSKYSNIGKKDIIAVISQVIRRVEAIEMTLNMLITFVDKDKGFDAFMKERLGGANEVQSNETDDGIGDNSENNENA